MPVARGDAILFVAPRERRLLNSIEKATKNKIELMEQPTAKSINEKRIRKFNQGISAALNHKEVSFYAQLIEQYRKEHDIPTLKIAAALAVLAQGDTPLLLEDRPAPRTERSSRSERQKQGGFESGKNRREHKSSKKKSSLPDHEMERYRIEVGHNHDVKPANIVGAIANEADIDAKYIGQIDIYDDHSHVDLPEGMPKELFKMLKKVWVSGQQLKISKVKKHARASEFEQRGRTGSPSSNRRTNPKKPNKSKKPARSGKTR